jgi:UDP-glucose 6-dehydrogenase
MSRVAVIGAGYVGLTTAACLADLGNNVVVVDIDEKKIAELQRNRVPFYEPGINELVERNARARRLRFSTSYVDAIPGAEYAIIAVSTPEGEGGEADLSYVEAAASSIADAMDGPLVVVNKSTVPPLTGDMVSSVLQKTNPTHPAPVVSNPEFLREGSAIQDFMHPDRVVIGSHDREAAEKVARLYAPLDAPILITPNIYTAEMVKYASNAFLATKISFINEIARISERVGADAKLVAEGMGLDERIGPRFLEAGIGYGGSCLVGDETVLIKDAGSTRLAPLWSVFENFGSGPGLRVLAWDPNTGSSSFLPIRTATVRAFKGEILDLRTTMSRRLSCTPDHPFVTRDGLKLARDLTTDDWLPVALGEVCMPPKVPVGATSVRSDGLLAGSIDHFLHTREDSRLRVMAGRGIVGSIGEDLGTEYVRQGDTAWVRVVNVKRHPFSGPVYSLEVPGANTFVTSGSLVTHNCFPKDVAALAAVAERFDYHPELLHAVMDINNDQRMLVIDKLREVLDELPGRVIGLLGLAFKPNTDDMREAPSLDIAKVLIAAGASVRAYDPAAVERARMLVPDIEYLKDAYAVASGADALVLITEWNEFRQLDLPRVKQLMRRPVIVDGRNIYDPALLKELGFTYRGIGRD